MKKSFFFWNVFIYDAAFKNFVAASRVQASYPAKETAVRPG
jgi:hypothetical protein